MDNQPPRGYAVAAAMQWAPYAKWVALALVLAGLVALLVVGIISWRDNARVESARQQWDTLYEAVKDKADPAERVAALEGVAEKVKGSSAHGYVLMELGQLHFEQAVDPVKSPEERKTSLDAAIKTYELVATSEPFKSNWTFGPLAVQGWVLSLEQAQEYDKAIAVLDEHLPKIEKLSHYLYNPLMADAGRLYWLRFRKSGNVKDKEAAREKLDEVLRVTSEEKGPFQPKWREAAEYIFSLVSKQGKALPEGAPVPAPKVVQPPAAAPMIQMPPVAPKAGERNIQVTPAPPKAAPKAAPKTEAPTKK
jgi:hypothetical protein